MEVTIVKKTMPIYDRCKIERTEADLLKAEASLDYIAMMADVDLPNEEEDEINDIHND